MSRLIKRKRRFVLDSSQLLVFGFLFLIVAGAFLLTLPVASHNGIGKPFFPCLFTAVSATCVTGLTVFDVGMECSLFGKAVLLALIQLGGLGFMTVGSVFSLFRKRNLSLNAKNTIVQTLNLSDYTGMRRLLRHVLLGTLLFEALGALILFFRFLPEFGFRGALLRGAFTSVSAFCNAGMDVNGLEPFGSFLSYSGDPVICLTIMFLIVMGGFGFFVWEDVFTVRKWKKLSLFSKIVLLGNAVLIFSGALFFFFFERTNPATLGSLPFGEQVLASFFQSVTYRTAGFSTVDFSKIGEPTAVLSCVYMFIGGSSGSTAGGIKVSTIALLFFAFWNVLRGRFRIVILGRKISIQTVLRAFTLCVIGICVTVFSGILICSVEHVPFVSALFECTSAFGTVGLSMGLTPSLSPFSLGLLMLLMFFGRLGLLTIAYVILIGLQSEDQLLDYPEAKIAIG